MSKQLVREPATGRIIACSWDDCWKPGDNRIREQLVDGVFTAEDGCHPLMVGTPKVLNVIFCRERHRQYWLNSHRDNGNLPAGHRGPLG